MATSNAETVTVACKLPHGLILRVFDMVDWAEPQQGGGTKTIQRAHPRPQQHVIKGYLPKYDSSLPPAAMIGSAFALTPGIPKDFWDQWLKQNRDLEAVKNGLVFAAVKTDTVQGHIEDHAKTRCGLEALDPSRLPRGLKKYDAKDAEATA